MNKIKIHFLLILAFVTVKTYSKIYDCFIFYNELELLEIRLTELYDHVDKFVLVESRETFRGNLKPLFFEENKHLFEKFLDKIIHVIVEDRLRVPSAWHREEFQRNQIVRGLIHCEDNDVILISDVDEIIRPSKVQDIVTILTNIQYSKLPIVLCNQTLYRYYFNRFDKKDSPWPGSIAIFYKHLKQCCPEYCRKLAQQRRIPCVVNDAGWHFTSMGGHGRVVSKLAAFSHAECDTPANRDAKNLYYKIQALPLVPIDASYPNIIVNNIQKYINEDFIDISKK